MAVLAFHIYQISFIGFKLIEQKNYTRLTKAPRVLSINLSYLPTLKYVKTNIRTFMCLD
jgi:hypothetical protein